MIPSPWRETTTTTTTTSRRRLWLPPIITMLKCKHERKIGGGEKEEFPSRGIREREKTKDEYVQRINFYNFLEK